MKALAAPPVEVRRETVVLPTYEPHEPDRNPMFLEKRVYQGSSGRVYPLPFTDRVAETPRPRSWEAIFIENEFIRVMLLPALGGRIHRVQDKTNNFDIIYYQPVIKPALVGLAGPWASGGIEFNWPQHHRPSTFLPADVEVETHPDGAMTVWMGDHDPMARLKGMHGVKLHPGRSVLELRVRAYNRTSDVQSFLWWSNVGIEAHELYQSFFPPDVTFVADHAKRAISTFPLCKGSYYGVNYAERARDGIPDSERPRQYPPQSARYAANDLSWYANIPVPTSYMALGSKEDFAGGYDHRAQAGIVHVADHNICPGKKQWTWGNQEFGYAWDRNLTDQDDQGKYRPYIELMAGTYTDNQPDFSFLQPGETKAWSQFWYPIRKIGVVHKASADAALSFRVDRGIARIGVCVTARHTSVRIILVRRGSVVGEWNQSLSPERPFLFEIMVDSKARPSDFTVTLAGESGCLLTYSPAAKAAPQVAPPPASEPAPPAEVPSSDELYVIGLHLEQYRHATRLPEEYWREAILRDPGDSRCHMALGRWHLRRGELASAESHLRTSIERLTSRNPNPYDGEAYYQLGRCLVLRALGEGRLEAVREEAYSAFFKSTWNHAWQSAAFLALAEMDASSGNWTKALEHVDRALRGNADHLRARDLKVIVLRQLGRGEDAGVLLCETISLDPLDWWARHLDGQQLNCDAQVRMDLALDYVSCGQYAAALSALDQGESAPAERIPGKAPAADLPGASLGTAPLVAYYRGWILHQLGKPTQGRAEYRRASRFATDYCFPARLEEIAILEHAMRENPSDARAPFYLGNLLYDRRRHAEAIPLWTRAARLEPRNATAWRNLGIASFNIEGNAAEARKCYDKACAVDPSDARLLYERDQLWKRLGMPVSRRLATMARNLDLVGRRDDLSVEFCALLNQSGRSKEALSIVSRRKFQPWEGGEGLALRQHVRTHLCLGRVALRKRSPAGAVAHFRAALAAPENLGEANHLLANQSDIHFWLGRALELSGETEAAKSHWEQAASFKGDFQSMSVRPVSEMSFYTALSLRALDRRKEADRAFRAILDYARNLAKAPATIDYFATSLPTMLLFDDDLKERQSLTAKLLEAQAWIGLGKASKGRLLLREVLRRDPSNAFAADQPL